MKNWGSRTNQICVTWWKDYNLPQMNTWNKQKCHISITFSTWFSINWDLAGAFLITSPSRALPLFSGLMAADWRISTSNFLSRPTLNICILTVDGNMHWFILSFKGFVEIKLKFALFLDGNLCNSDLCNYGISSNYTFNLPLFSKIILNQLPVLLLW